MKNESTSEDKLKELHQNHPRRFGDMTYVYPVVSRRAGGVSIGVNLNLNQVCNFDCPYCQVHRQDEEAREQKIDLKVLEKELRVFLAFYASDDWGEELLFPDIEPEDQFLKDICLSGDGEATTIPEFSLVVELLRKLQDEFATLKFKLVLITNASRLGIDSVREAVGELCSQDGEIWAKFDAGTEKWYQEVNRSRVPWQMIRENLAYAALNFPLRIQTMWCRLGKHLPSEEEVFEWESYLKLLTQVPEHQIKEIQVYTVARQPSESYVFPVEAEWLEEYAGRLKSQVDVPVGVYI